MNPVSRGTVHCTRCRASGLVDDRSVCPLCDGAGEYQRLIVPLKVIAVSDLSPTPDLAFRRMAVLLSEHSDDGRVLVRGVTDAGMGLAASVSASRFSKVAHSEFVECERWWAP